MLIALVLANYVGGFRTASAAATRRARSMELLQTLAVDLIRSDDLRPALRRTLSDLTEALGLRGAALRVTVRDQELDERVGDDARGNGAARSRRCTPRTARRCVTLRGEGGVLALPISDSGITFGLLAVDTGHRARRAARRSRCSSRSAASSASRSGARASSTRACCCRRSRRPTVCAPRFCSPSRTTCARR